MNEEFPSQIRLALEHMHDFAHLQTLPLVASLCASSGQSSEQSVRRLQQTLIEAIECLRPAGAVSARARELRPYAILYGRYVQGLETSDLLEELAISVRQLRREHKRALQAVGDLMWEQLHESLLQAEVAGLQPAYPSERREAASAEVEEFVRNVPHETIDLRSLLQDLVTLLQPVLVQHHTELRLELPEPLPGVRANRVVLRQGLLSALSYSIHRAGNGEVLLSATQPDHEVLLSVQANGSVIDAPREGVGFEISRKLVSASGGQIELTDAPESWKATIRLPVAERVSILIIDDNAGLIALFRRYLVGSQYTVLEAHSSAEAIDLTRSANVGLIILDVMMPDMDGWEVLQRLKREPHTAQVPVMICSVMNEPELAFSLGASDYLTKPVSQSDLLAKVDYWCGVVQR